jgi:hypothetical protein
MAQYFDFLEQHVGSGKWNAVLSEDMLTTREALEIIAAMNEVFPALTKRYDGEMTVWCDAHDGSPVFAIKY